MNKKHKHRWVKTKKGCCIGTQSWACKCGEVKVKTI